MSPFSLVPSRPDQEAPLLEAPPDIGWAWGQPLPILALILPLSLFLAMARWSFAKGALGFPPFGGWTFPIPTSP